MIQPKQKTSSVMRTTYCRILKGEFLKSKAGNLSSLTLPQPGFSFLNKYTALPAEFADGSLFVMKKLHPFPARARQNDSMESILSPLTLEKSGTEQQSQFLKLSGFASAAGSKPPAATRANVNIPLDSATKARRWGREADESEGKGRTAAESGNGHDDDHDDGLHSGDDGGVDDDG